VAKKLSSNQRLGYNHFQSLKVVFLRAGRTLCMPAAESQDTPRGVLFDAGVFIGALLKGDLRRTEARPLVERARRGEFRACTTVGILSEVYGALTWEKAEPRHDPAEAAQAVRLLEEPPSAIVVLNENLAGALKTLELAAKHQLTARRVHDARHAATALVAGVRSVYTYDAEDWQVFASDGLHIVGPPSTITRLASS
jgi:predicted nucleic acid-binding protein